METPCRRGFERSFTPARRRLAKADEVSGGDYTEGRLQRRRRRGRQVQLVPATVARVDRRLGLTEVWPAVAVIVVGCAVYLSSPMTNLALRRKARVTLQALAGAFV